VQELQTELAGARAQLEDAQTAFRAQLADAQTALQQQEEEARSAKLRATQAEAQATWTAVQLARLVEAAATSTKESARQLRVAAQYILGEHEISCDEPGPILTRVRQRVRELERELDSAEAERDRLQSMLSKHADRPSWYRNILESLLRFLMPRAWSRA
jgi:chromosome segregation ATPase